MLQSSDEVAKTTPITDLTSDHDLSQLIESIMRRRTVGDTVASSLQDTSQQDMANLPINAGSVSHAMGVATQINGLVQLRAASVADALQNGVVDEDTKTGILGFGTTVSGLQTRVGLLETSITAAERNVLNQVPSDPKEITNALRPIIDINLPIADQVQAGSFTRRAVTQPGRITTLRRALALSTQDSTLHTFLQQQINS